MQFTVLAITLAFMAAITLFFVSAIRSTDVDTVENSPGRTRTRLIWAMLVFGAFVTFGSLWAWPHALSGSQNTITVNATGFQWYWEIDKEEVQLGQPVVFNVHTKDVTHGLGVMDPDGKILFQTQGMPGYVNKVEHVFSTAGKYKVVCMEFCGTGHHSMITEFNVVAQ